MIAIPVLEIKNGVCSGVPDDEAFRSISPDDVVAIAQAWSVLGFTRLHVVDHDALAGIGSNASLLDDIVRDSSLEIQANGGVQTSDGVQRLLDAGAARVVVGTRGLADPEWLISLAESNPGLVILETSLRDRRVVVRGWVRNLPMDIFDVTDDLDGVPLAGLLVSATASDGARAVTELGLLEDLAELCEFPVLAAGRVTALSDLRALEHRGVAGIVMAAGQFAGEVDARWVAREFGA